MQSPLKTKILTLLAEFWVSTMAQCGRVNSGLANSRRSGTIRALFFCPSDCVGACEDKP